MTKIVTHEGFILNYGHNLWGLGLNFVPLKDNQCGDPGFFL